MKIPAVNNAYILTEMSLVDLVLYTFNNCGKSEPEESVAATKPMIVMYVSKLDLIIIYSAYILAYLYP